MRWLDSTSWVGLVTNVVAALALLVVINVPAPWLGLNFESDTPDVALAPPGWLVVTAWLLLFPAMGVARWYLLRSESADAPQLRNLIVILAVVCASYAYYTLLPARLTGISAAVYGLLGNIAVIAFSGFLAARAAPISIPAAGLLTSVAVWTAFASVSVVQLVWRGR